MKKFARRVAIVAAGVAVSIGLVGGTAGVAHADSSWPAVKPTKTNPNKMDSAWPA